MTNCTKPVRTESTRAAASSGQSARRPFPYRLFYRRAPRRASLHGWLPVGGALVLGALLTTSVVWGASTASGVPWEGALTAILDILSGTTARLLAALMFIGGALLWGFSRSDDGMQMIGRVILAAGLVVGAASISTTIFGAVL